jgi:hypothetical protein
LVGWKAGFKGVLLKGEDCQVLLHQWQVFGKDWWGQGGDKVQHHQGNAMECQEEDRL